MNICITGGAGKLGRRAVEALSSHKLTIVSISYPAGFAPDVLKIEGSIGNRKLLEKVFQTQDVVVHLAAARECASTLNDERWLVNVEGTRNVAQAALAAGVKKLVYVSSLSVLHGYAGTSHMGTEELKPRPTTFYGFTKFLGEEIVKYYALSGRLKVIVLRPMAIVEEGDDAAWLEKTAPNFRVSARDAAQACRLAIEEDVGTPYEVFHVCGNHPKREWCDEKARRILHYKPLD